MSTSLEQILKDFSPSTSKLNLNNKNLIGEIPSSILKFSKLQHLNLRSNELSLEIPSYISKLSQLQILYLHNNKFLGDIPNSISNLSKLQQLNISDNQLTGEIPNSISNLIYLQNLNLGNNNLSGEIPSSIFNLSSLQVLYLSNNELSGEIPSSISQLTNLEYLSLNNNLLSGDIPDSISNLSKLSWLKIDNNYFTKPMPQCLKTKKLTLYTNNAFQEMSETLKKQLEEEKKLRNETNNVNSIWNVISNTYKWNNNDVEIIHKIEDILKNEKLLSNNKKTYHDINELSSTKEYLTIHENFIYTWEEVFSYLKSKQTNTNDLYDSHYSKLDSINIEYDNIRNKEKKLDEKLKRLKQERKQIEDKKEQILNELEHIKEPIEQINNITKQVEEIILENKEINNKVKQVLEKSNKLQNPISKDDLMILLERMNLVQYYDTCITNELYSNIEDFDEGLLIDIGMTSRDACCFLYNIEMIQVQKNLDNISDGNCAICELTTPIKTIELLQEWKIDINTEIIINNNWIAPYLLYFSRFKELGVTQLLQIKKKIKEYAKLHNNHLSELLEIK